jgi:hypothetical protein
MKDTNLRGQHVTFTLTGKRWLRGVVVTRIRGSRWMIQSSELPELYLRPSGVRRITLDRDDFIIETAPIRRARSPIEAMIDKACGFASPRPEGPQEGAK